MTTEQKTAVCAFIINDIAAFKEKIMPHFGFDESTPFRMVMISGSKEAFNQFVLGSEEKESAA